MSWLSKDYIDFFIELAGSNNKEWFDENRKRYEKSVREPFKLFVKEMIARMHVIHPEIAIAPKDAIFRINRDIRFSPDKTPYKLYMSAAISEKGRKDHSNPGLYFQSGPEDFRIYGGLYQLDKEQLQKVRTHIMNHTEAFNKILSAKGFKTHFRGEIAGDKNKRIAKEFKEAAEQQALIFNKQFYYYAVLDAETILDENLPDIIMKYYMAGKPLRDFLHNALKA